MKPYKNLATLSAALITLGAVTENSNASVLTFESTTFSTNGAIIDQNYGDRITSTTDGAFSYGSDGGFTPNVEVTYLSSGGNDLSHWTTGYNELSGVAYNEVDGALGFSILLQADPGFNVNLDGFDLGNFGGSPVTLPSLQVLGEGGSVLLSLTDVVINANSGSSIGFDFNPGLSSSQILIEIDTTGLGGASDNVGIDNIAFSQVQIPEPSSAILLGSGALLIGCLRRR